MPRGQGSHLLAVITAVVSRRPRQSPANLDKMQIQQTPLLTGGGVQSACSAASAVRI